MSILKNLGIDVEMLNQQPKKLSQSTGGSYVAPKAGKALVRLVSYVEVGKHEDNFKGEKKVNEKVELVFELHGKNYPLNANGQPSRITVRENLSMFEKSNFYKLFVMLKGNRSIRHMAQLVGEGWLAEVYNTTGANGITYATFKTKEKPYNFSLPIIEDPVTGEEKEISIPQPISQLKVFIWDFPTKESWNSLYIEGEYNGISRNVLQEKIRNALNYKGSKIEMIDKNIQIEVPQLVQPEKNLFDEDEADDNYFDF